MESDLVGRCARCLKRHRGACVALGFGILSQVVYPTLQTFQNGQPDGNPRPVVALSTATDASSAGALYISSPNMFVAAPDYSGPAPKLWQIVKRTPGAERPVTPEQKDTWWWDQPVKLDKA
jgi:hypothetical protein